MRKTGVLVVNLGTPDAPDTAAVRRYLGQFLSDPRVIDMHPVARWLLLHLVILRIRPAKSAEAYRKVWTDKGSPLLAFGHALVAAMEEALRVAPQEAPPIALAMRYGNPSIEQGLDTLRAQGCSQLVVFPLYPQYASSSTGSTVQAVYDVLATKWNTPFVAVVPPFYDDDGFLDAWAARGRAVLDKVQPDHVLMSFHGLPERHIRKSDESGQHCLASSSCCDVIGLNNQHCYRAHCVATARGIAQRLNLPRESYTLCFQSRLGRDPWLTPATDVVVPELARAGKKRVVVFCPAFVADCLETLEEIGIRAAEDFRAAGGDVLTLVPSLNADPAWVGAATSMVQRSLRVFNVT